VRLILLHPLQIQAHVGEDDNRIALPHAN